MRERRAFSRMNIGSPKIYLQKYFQDQFQQILERHDGEKQGSKRKKGRHDEVEQSEEIDGKGLHLLDKGVI